MSSFVVALRGAPYNILTLLLCAQLVLAMTNGNWVGCLCLSFVAAMSCAMAIGDITQMRMVRYT